MCNDLLFAGCYVFAALLDGNIRCAALCCCTVVLRIENEEDGLSCGTN